MAGSVWARGDGRYGVEVPYRDAFGRRRVRSTTKATEEEARAWLEQMRASIADEELTAHTSQTVGAYLDEWLRDAVEPRVSPRTYDKRSWAVRIHIAPALGRVRLSDLSPRSIQTLYASLAREGYSYSTRREIHITLRMALEQAVRWSLLRRNPVEMVDAPRDLANVSDGEIRALTDAQARILFASAKDSRWRNYYVTAIRTGLRPGEMLALRWEDVDTGADPGSVRVRRTLDTHSAAVFGPPKTPAARRTVALHYEARDAFISQREMLVSEGLSAGPRDLVFPSTAGTPMSSDNLRKRYLHADLSRAGLPRLSLHELRHTFASIMLHEWLAPPAVVSQMLGHRSIAFTFDLYGHLIPSAQSDLMRQLNASQRRSDTG